MARKYTAILLKKIKYGEKNLILQTFTIEEGNKTFFLHSSKLKGKNKIVLPPLCILEIVSGTGKGNLPVAKEILLKEKFYDLMTNLEKASIIMFLNEVLQKTIGEYHVDEDLFRFVIQSLNELDKTEESYANFHLKFLIILSQHLGFSPNEQHVQEHSIFDLYEGRFTIDEPLHGAILDSEEAKVFLSFLKSDNMLASEVKISSAQRRKLLSALLDYYRIHIDKFDEVNSKEILEELFS